MSGYCEAQRKCESLKKTKTMSVCIMVSFLDSHNKAGSALHDIYVVDVDGWQQPAGRWKRILLWSRTPMSAIRQLDDLDRTGYFSTLSWLFWDWNSHFITVSYGSALDNEGKVFCWNIAFGEWRWKGTQPCQQPGFFHLPALSLSSNYQDDTGKIYLPYKVRTYKVHKYRHSQSQKMHCITAVLFSLFSPQ